GLPLGQQASFDDVLSAVHPDDRTYVEEQRRQALDAKTGFEFEFQYRVIGTDGELRWVECHGRVLEPLNQPGHRRVIGVLLDRTKWHEMDEFRKETNRELQRANEEIAQAAARTREVIELSPDAFFLADMDLRITEVNAAACKMLGYERNEVIGKTFFDLIR